MEIPKLSALDEVMRQFMTTRTIPGGALAVSRGGKLLFARGYSFAMDDEAIEPTTRFRIASISKPITATGILKLAEEGRINLSQPFVDVLRLSPPVGAEMDPRLKRVTIRHLLQHLGGWDRSKTLDPMSSPADQIIAEYFNKSLPVTKRDIARYMMGQALQHDPGTVQVYSNFGYSLLGLVIEEVTGRSYENYVKESVFSPLGIRQAQLGRTLIENRAENEARYHCAGTGRSVFSRSRSKLPLAYGGNWNLENMDSHGGWIASAVDIVRFVSAFDNPRNSQLLREDSIRQMFALPEHLNAVEYPRGGMYYASGWYVRSYGEGRFNAWHGGELSGSKSYMVRMWNGNTNWCALFNQNADSSGQNYEQEIDRLVGDALRTTNAFPEHDLFDQYG